MKRLKRGMPGLCDSEVEHWAWPLFDTKRWGRWRRERLHLMRFLPYASAKDTTHLCNITDYVLFLVIGQNQRG